MISITQKLKAIFKINVFFEFKTNIGFWKVFDSLPFRPKPLLAP